MGKEVAKKQKCILLREGIELWLDEEQAEAIDRILISNSTNRFIKVDNRTINVADITGVFSAQDLEDVKRRRLGQWKCDLGNWHSKTEICNCVSVKRQKEEEAEMQRKIKESEELQTPEARESIKKTIGGMRENLVNKFKLK